MTASRIAKVPATEMEPVSSRNRQALKMPNLTHTLMSLHSAPESKFYTKIFERMPSENNNFEDITFKNL